MQHQYIYNTHTHPHAHPHTHTPMTFMFNHVLKICYFVFRILYIMMHNKEHSFIWYIQIQSEGKYNYKHLSWLYKTEFSNNVYTVRHTHDAISNLQYIYRYYMMELEDTNSDFTQTLFDVTV